MTEHDGAPETLDDRLIDATARIIESYVTAAGATLDPGNLPGLVVEVKRALAADVLSGLEALVVAPVEGAPTIPAAAPQPKADRPVPAVPIEKSVAHDALTCLECGRKMVMTKGHIKTEHGMTPDEYRAKWGLPADYPFITAAYSEERANLAKRAGLGKYSRT